MEDHPFSPCYWQSKLLTRQRRQFLRTSFPITYCSSPQIRRTPSAPSSIPGRHSLHSPRASVPGEFWAPTRSSTATGSRRQYNYEHHYTRYSNTDGSSAESAPLPQIAEEPWQGTWVAKTCPDTAGQMASDIGPIDADGGDYLRFLLLCRRIMACLLSDTDKANLVHRSANFSAPAATHSASSSNTTVGRTRCSANSTDSPLGLNRARLERAFSCAVKINHISCLTDQSRCVII